MSNNRILWAILCGHDKYEGKQAILQRVVISPEKTLEDAEKAIDDAYPTWTLIDWVTGYTSHYNSSDLKV